MPVVYGKEARFISSTNEFHLARRRVLRSERALRDYVRSARSDSEEEKLLAQAVKPARRELVDSVAYLSPDVTRCFPGPMPPDASTRKA